MTSFCGKEKRNKATFNTSVKMRPGTFGLAKAADDQKKSWERRARAQSGFWRACKAVPQHDTGRRRPNAYVGYAFRLLLEATSAIFYSQEIHFANGSKKPQKNNKTNSAVLHHFSPPPKNRPILCSLSKWDAAWSTSQRGLSAPVCPPSHAAGPNFATRTFVQSDSGESLGDVTRLRLQTDRAIRGKPLFGTFWAL